MQSKGNTFESIEPKTFMLRRGTRKRTRLKLASWQTFFETFSMKSMNTPIAKNSSELFEIGKSTWCATEPCFIASFLDFLLPLEGKIKGIRSSSRKDEEVLRYRWIVNSRKQECRCKKRSMWLHIVGANHPSQRCFLRVGLISPQLDRSRDGGLDG